jgi:sugar/nucleoside kinase (ribokinase family)
LLVFGNLTIDDTVMPDGRTAMGSLGGNVLYAAIGAHLWTDDVVMVARLGRGYPQSNLDRMAAAGLRLDGLIPNSHNSIRQWQLYDVEGGRRYVRLASAATYADLSPRRDELPDHLTHPRACHIAPLDVEIQAELVDWARERGATVTVDPHFDSVAGKASAWRELLPLVDAFLPSREEAQEILGGWDGAEAAARGLAELGAPIVCLKLGSEGSLVYRAADGWFWHADSGVSNPVDTTGCGDAFCGGFLAGWCETGDLRTAVLYGTVSASFVASDFGADHSLLRDQAEARRRLAEREARSL